MSEDKVETLLTRMMGVRPPPAYAKALSKMYHQMRIFLQKFKKNDSEMVKRFLRRARDIEFLVEDMRKANAEASNRKLFPAVFMPSGLWEDILGVDHSKPEDGEHWPINQPDGPITWKD